MKQFHFAATILFVLASLTSFAQEPCADLLTDEYVSNGQYYTTPINFNETKDCEITFIGGNEYRIITCTRNSSKIHMQLIDNQENLLFDNQKHSYSNFWNFQIKKTITCTVKLTLVENNVESDEIILLVGFKK